MFWILLEGTHTPSSIFSHFSKMRWYKQVKFLMVEDENPLNLQNQYHCCCWPGDASRQGISSHGIDLVFHECLGLGASWINTLRPRQNGRHFPDDILKCIFFNENVRIAIEISLKFVPKGPINNISALFQIMAWCRSGDKPLSEPMMVSLPTHICVTRSQWANIHKIWTKWHF